MRGRPETSGQGVLGGLWVGNRKAAVPKYLKKWWAVRASNSRPSGCKPDALTN
jgi:hypothetical protein